LLLEVTEGSVHVVLVSLASGVVGSAYHGLFSTSRVRGASGAIYGILWSQISLLALNFRDMPGRWLRMLVALLLLGAEIATYQLQHNDKVSYQAHLFGAAAGTFVSLVSGRNVVFYRWELLLNAVGALGYTALLVPIFRSGQWACALWAATVCPLLLWAIYLATLRASLGRPTSRLEAEAWAKGDSQKEKQPPRVLPRPRNRDWSHPIRGRKLRVAPTGHTPQVQWAPEAAWPSGELPRGRPPPSAVYPPKATPQMPPRLPQGLPPPPPPHLPPQAAMRAQVAHTHCFRANAPPPPTSSMQLVMWPPPNPMPPARMPEARALPPLRRGPVTTNL